MAPVIRGSLRPFGGPQGRTAGRAPGRIAGRAADRGRPFYEFFASMKSPLAAEVLGRIRELCAIAAEIRARGQAQPLARAGFTTLADASGQDRRPHCRDGQPGAHRFGGCSPVSLGISTPPDHDARGPRPELARSSRPSTPARYSAIRDEKDASRNRVRRSEGRRRSVELNNKG